MIVVTAFESAARNFIVFTEVDGQCRALAPRLC
jgi:hypothetical protein